MERNKNTRNWIDTTLDDSFPASDPPAWTMGREPPPPAETPAPPERVKARRGRATAKPNTGRSGKG